MFKWLGQPLGKRKQKTRQLWEREFNIADKGLDEKQVIALVNDLIAKHKAPQQAAAPSLRSIIQKAITDAEQLTASIKGRAQAEAEAEGVGIIDQAKQEAEEIKKRAEIAAQKEAEDIISAANRKAEITEAELRDKRVKLSESKSFELKEYETALLSTSGEAAPPIETPAPTESKIEPDMADKEKIEQPVQPKEEAVAPEPVGTTTAEFLEQHLPEERPGREEARSAPSKQDSQTLYTGEVELDIATPIDLKMVSKLYNYLQTIPEIKILHTKGSWDRDTTITVVLDKPIPLISVISKIEGVEATPELPEKDTSGKGKSSSLLGKRKKGAKRIRLTPKEKQSL